MTTEPTASDAIPPRLRWYAVWKWKRRWRACLILSLILGYPLSMGPTIWLRQHGYLPMEAMFVYWPLILFVSISDPLQNALHWYATAWNSLP